MVGCGHFRPICSLGPKTLVDSTKKAFNIISFFFWSFDMNQNQNLRFFLALGNQKVVVLQGQENMDVYATPTPGRMNVSVGRLALAVSGK